MRRLALVIVVGFAAPAHAERPRLERVPARIDPATVGSVVNSKLIFLNRCAGGCTVTPGYTDSRTNTTGIANVPGTLSAYSYGDASWNDVVSCMTKVMEPFNVTVTDNDPGPSVDHFEIMIAGTPEQIGLPPSIGGVAEYSCSSPGLCTKYIPNALVFDFAGTWAGDINDICATAAQEIAHTWTLDHVVDATDPMTHFNFNGMRLFKDNVKCGSDCRGMTGISPFGLTCTPSSNPAAPCPTNQPSCEHTCMSTGTAIQNNVEILLALFGPKGAVAPTLTVTNPPNGSAQAPGFEITGDCTSGDGVQEIQIWIDGVSKAAFTTAQFAYPTPATLADGAHAVKVLCASNLQATTTVTTEVVVSRPGADATGVDEVAGCCDTSGGTGVGSMLLALGVAATFVTRRRVRFRR